ncbi:hypothetical protein SDC9_18580 [bioreactor metagenome]|uniref:Uncharacterized protein n=1 Tax=bioreactor metagenome TaxID=1076179 RepID=A0A644U0X1_9ZZZZ|nr:hypothetical protein [Bacteroidales bacterium]MDY4790125.1 hypothetical protein [Bacteroidales bacterium]
MEKNTGKTETLNYVLSCLCSYNGVRVGITSIGIDGEKTDQVTKTQKPEINISKGTLFITSEHFYKQKEIVSNILSISKKGTSLGRLITAEAISQGKVLLAGASNTIWLKETIKELHNYKADVVLVDGALSRKSFGSPSITDAMILSTGAALSINLNTLVQKTNFVYRMTQLESIEKSLTKKLQDIDSGIYAIDLNGKIIDLDIPSILMIEQFKDRIFNYGKRIFVSGIITDKLIDFLKVQKNINDIEIIVKDFTRIFCKPENIDSYFKKGGKLKVVQPTNIIAITVNPTSPSGYNLNSKTLIDELKKHIPMPIYNIKEI